ncbi:MAG: HlyD family efflux transporter periplasmic adaptor subunit [Ideonella sp.]|nr:HlyD family efflux transporter periplasmic adaptor subunit [Ideonella sp.]
MSRLFRPEALEGQRQAWLGTIRLIRPVSLTVLTLAVVATVVAIGLFLCLGEYTRRMTVGGVLAPDRGVIRLMPPQPGTVLESHVVEGQSVQRGEVLFVLDIGQASELGDTQSAVADSLTARERSLRASARQQQALLDTQRSAIGGQRRDLQRELRQIDTESDLQAQRLALARQALERAESLRAENFYSAAQVQTRREELLAVQAAQQSLARQRLAKQRELAALDAQERELPLLSQARQGEIERDLAEVAQASAENASRRRAVVRAPEAGMVGAVTAQVGQRAPTSVALASLIPGDARLQAQLYAPSSAVGFIRPDQPVRLRYQAFPYQKFGHHGGHVVQVSRTPLQASELAGLPLTLPGAGSSAPSEPLYRITVALDAQAVQAYGQPQALAPGMQLDADVLLDRRKLIEWIFEPLISVTGRV